MNIPEICLSFIVLLLGVAYPLMLQIISRLEEKYSSIVLLNLMKKEMVWRVFSISLIVSLFFALFYIINSLLIIKIEQYPLNVGYVISFLMLLSTIVLVIVFLLFIHKVVKYYSRSDLLKYFIKKDRKNKNEDFFDFFHVISDFLYISIRNQDETIARTISDYFYEIFHTYRNQNKGKDKEYPNPYYAMIYKATEELAELDDNKLVFLEARTVGGIWLLGELKDYPIHKTTYSWLWSNLVLAVSHNQDNMVLYYWERANQHFTYRLQHISTILFPKKPELNNMKDVKKRNRERNYFLEFHYVLGGLLLYRNRYDCIGRIFLFTQSIPPKYELLPDWMDQIFSLYVKFNDPYDRDTFRIYSQYYFPNTEGFHRESVIKNNVRKYASLLFLRQYSIVPYLSNMEPLGNPTIPNTQRTKKRWLESLYSFPNTVQETLDNKTLLKATGLDFITDDWCTNNDKTKPTEFIEKFLKDLEESFEMEQIDQPISDKKKEKFFRYTKKILEETFEDYKIISNESIIEKDFKDWSIVGMTAIIDKNSFADNQESEDLNYYSFLADSLIENYKLNISETFYYQATNRFLIKPKDLFDAIDKLKIKAEDYLMVSFGLDFDRYEEFLNTSGLEDNNYKGVEIINFPSCNYQLVCETMFILKKENLPTIDLIEIDKESIDKYSLVPISKNYKLFASVIDLNQDESLRSEVPGSKTIEEILKSVLLCIQMNVRVRWNSNMKMISLRLHSKFAERGLPNDLAEIKPFSSY